MLRYAVLRGELPVKLGGWRVRGRQAPCHGKWRVDAPTTPTTPTACQKCNIQGRVHVTSAHPSSSSSHTLYLLSLKFSQPVY